MDKTFLENKGEMMPHARQIFDNLLRKEFLTFEEVVAFFQRYGPRWVRQQMASGNLPYRTYGRDGVLFYVPEVRQAILDGRLAPIRKVQNDSRETKKERDGLRDGDPIQRASSLKDLRNLARGQ